MTLTSTTFITVSITCGNLGIRCSRRFLDSGSARRLRLRPRLLRLCHPLRGLSVIVQALDTALATPATFRVLSRAADFGRPTRSAGTKRPTPLQAGLSKAGTSSTRPGGRGGGLGIPSARDTESLTVGAAIGSLIALDLSQTNISHGLWPRNSALVVLARAPILHASCPLLTLRARQVRQPVGKISGSNVRIDIRSNCVTIGASCVFRRRYEEVRLK